MMGIDSIAFIIGVGSPHGDDQIGWMVADKLNASQHFPRGVKKVNSPMHLLDCLDGVRHLHVVDACRSGTSPGTIFRYVWPDDRLTQLGWSGTHDFNLAAVLRLASELQLLPSRVIVWGIEGSVFGANETASADIGDWVTESASQIQRELLSDA